MGLNLAILDNEDLETWAVTFCKCQDYIEPEPGGFPAMDGLWPSQTR